MTDYNMIKITKQDAVTTVSFNVPNLTVDQGLEQGAADFRPYKKSKAQKSTYRF